MDKRQLSKVKMGNTVSFVLDNDEETVDGTPGLRAAKTELDNVIDEIEFHNRAQGDTGKEVTGTKNSSRKNLENSFRKVSSAIVAHGVNTTITAEKELARKHEYTDTDIRRMSDNDIFTKSYVLYGDAFPLATKLVPFTTEAEITLLKTNADDFAYLLPQKRAKIVASSVSTANLDEAIRKMMDIFNNKMDKLVDGVRFTKVEFYKIFKNARMIPDPPYRSTTEDK